MTTRCFLYPAVFAAFTLFQTATAASFTFQTLDNGGDPMFNQLLGINSSGVIAGYFGDGVVLPNKGYTLAPPYTTLNYTNENFPGSTQTQVTGINSNSPATTVGFWVDNAGDNFGWVKTSSGFVQVVDPNEPAAGTGVTLTDQLLGVNNSNVAVGFYVGTDTATHGFIYSIGSQTFMDVVLPAGFDATAVTATGINNSGVISGFYTDGMDVTHGFIDHAGTFTSFNDPSANGNTMFLGLNNNGFVVGSYVDAAGETHGLLYNSLTNTWQTIDDPGASATAAFMVTGTTVNGINDQNQLVGFFSDGKNVNGFLADPVPEPVSLALTGIGLCALGLLRRSLKA